MQDIATIKSLLASRGLRPKHRFGQNFLHDPHAMRAILQAADLVADPRPRSLGVVAMDYPGEGLIYRILKTNFAAEGAPPPRQPRRRRN